MLTFDSYMSEPLDLSKGLNQGCPLLGIAFQFYNTDVVEVCTPSNGEQVVALMDNTLMLARGESLMESNDRVRCMMTRQGCSLDWESLHQCEFAVSKFGIMGLTRRHKKNVASKLLTKPIQRSPLLLQGVKIPMVSTHKFLSVILDQELQWKDHINYVLQKGAKWVTQRLAKLSKGVSPKYMQSQKTSRNTVVVYLDGSGKDGQAGTVAVQGMLRAHMGSLDQNTIFKAKVLGMSLAAELIKAERRPQLATIRVDSQAMILMTRHARSQASTWWMHSICRWHRSDTSTLVDVELRWTLGYQGILGNEHMDKAAKKATLCQSSSQQQLLLSCRMELLASHLAARQCHMKKVNVVKSVKWFESSPRCQRLHRVDPSMLSPRFRRDTLNIERWQASMLVQLRTISPYRSISTGWGARVP